MDKLIGGNNFQIVLVADPVTGLPVSPAGGSASPAPIPPVATADGATPANTWIEALALFNGASFDRARGNVDLGALITHASASAGVSGADQLNVNGRGVQVGVNITAGTGTTPTLQITVEGKDSASGTYYQLFASAGLTAAPGFTLLSVYPGLLGSATAGNQTLPRTWRIRTVIGGVTPSITATVGATVII